MCNIPTGYGATIHEVPLQQAHATHPSAVSPPENGDSSSSSTELIHALDEVLSELRALEIKYLLEPDSSDGPAIKAPFLLRLKFRCKGNRDLKAILGELRRHNEDLKAMTNDLRETIRCNLAMSAHRMNPMGVEIHPATGHITPPQADAGFSTLSTEDLVVRWNFEITARQMPHVEPSPTAGHITPPGAEPSSAIPCIENSNLDAPPVGMTPPCPVGTTPPPVGGEVPTVDREVPPGDGELPPARTSMPPRARDYTAIDNPPSSHARPSFTGSWHGINTHGREFHSSDSFSSHEREDNYSTHTGDKICTQCHQVWRRD